MWLINTSTGRLKLFKNPSEVRYAILSHVWREDEQTLQDLETLMRDHHIPRDHTIDKIRKCCIYAERDGYEWLWVDTCCINKESSAELSEAINSMFAWYAQAGVCYAFLDDVREEEDPQARGLSFWKSRWWTRGWTLQELVAPKHLIFLSESWVSLGTRISLADVVEGISGVDRGILLGELSLDEISVARRMSWASRRQTTRVEDRAYSLLGIFGVHLPTIYGEGGDAFTRLQEEIIRTIPDQSIFAWGPVLDDYPLSCKEFAKDGSFRHPRMHHLLAPSPDVFVDAAEISPTPIETLSKATRLQLENPSCSFTSYGCHVELPIIGCQLVPHLNLGAQADVLVALLACEDRQNHRPLALLLRLKPNMWNDYYVGNYCSIGPPIRPSGITTPMTSAASCEVSDTPMIDTQPEYHRVVSLVESLDHLDGLASVRKVYVHTGDHPLGLARSRESADARARQKMLYEEFWWRSKISIQSTSVLAGLSATFIPLTARVIAMSANSRKSGTIALGLAFISFELYQLMIYFQSYERRPLPWLHLQPIPAWSTLRLLNAPYSDFVLIWAWWRILDLYFLLMPFIVLVSIHYLGL